MEGLSTEKKSVTQKPTANLAAYDDYLKGRFAWNQRTESALRQSIRHLKAAVEADPDFTLALAGLADSYLTLGIYGGAAPQSVMPVAREAADRVLQLDPRGRVVRVAPELRSPRQVAGTATGTGTAVMSAAA